MRLIDFYRHDIAGLPSKEAAKTRALWHQTAKRYLALQSITSDPVPDFKPHIVIAREGEPDEERYEVVTKPVDASLIGYSFFLRRPTAELVELYRATKPRKPAA